MELSIPILVLKSLVGEQSPLPTRISVSPLNWVIRKPPQVVKNIALLINSFHFPSLFTHQKVQKEKYPLDFFTFSLFLCEEFWYPSRHFKVYSPLRVCMMRVLLNDLNFGFPWKAPMLKWINSIPIIGRLLPVLSAFCLHIQNLLPAFSDDKFNKILCIIDLIM